MFQLAEIRRMVRIPPWHFGKTLDQSVAEELNHKLANKVVLDLGLCIALFDIISLEDSYIFPGDGSSHTQVKFRYVVFRPFMDEILEGVIKESSPEGLKVSLGFFEDVFIRKDLMLTNTRFDEAEKSWVWDYENDNEIHTLFMDIGEKIRFRVVEEQFTDTTPNNPNEKHDDKEKKVAPYIIIGAANELGLGMVAWWNTPDEEEDESIEENGEEICDANGIVEEP